MHPDAVIAVVSDHGFAPISHETNLFRAFIDAGLITVDTGGKVTAWEAMPWPSGGSAAIMLARADDAALTTRVAGVLAKLQADPANGIAAIAGRAEIAALRGNPQASFFVNFSPGNSAGGFGDAVGGLTRASRIKGTHGYFPAAPAMRSTFMMIGPGIPQGKSLGEIDMRAIAPTLAAIMHFRLSGAELPALVYKRGNQP